MISPRSAAELVNPELEITVKKYGTIVISSLPQDGNSPWIVKASILNDYNQIIISEEGYDSRHAIYNLYHELKRTLLNA